MQEFADLKIDVEYKCMTCAGCMLFFYVPKYLLDLKRMVFCPVCKSLIELGRVEDKE